MELVGCRGLRSRGQEGNKRTREQESKGARERGSKGARGEGRGGRGEGEAGQRGGEREDIPQLSDTLLEQGESCCRQYSLSS